MHLWYLQESNQGHTDFQSVALPTELRYQYFKVFNVRSGNRMLPLVVSILTFALRIVSARDTRPDNYRGSVRCLPPDNYRES